jgi:hypothetical protein
MKPPVSSQRNRYTLGEWLAEGERRFGPDQIKWRFKCPACGHVQAVEDFRPFKSQGGVTAETARFNCIGRYAGAKRRAFGDDGPGPCDYTSGGLLDLRPVIVLADGQEVRSFDFADPDPAPGVTCFVDTEVGMTMGDTTLQQLPDGRWKATCPIGTIFGSEVEGECCGVGTTKEAAIEALSQDRKNLNDSLWE